MLMKVQQMIFMTIPTSSIYFGSLNMKRALLENERAFSRIYVPLIAYPSLIYSRILHTRV